MSATTTPFGFRVFQTFTQQSVVECLAEQDSQPIPHVRALGLLIRFGNGNGEGVQYSLQSFWMPGVYCFWRRQFERGQLLSSLGSKSLS